MAWKKKKELSPTQVRNFTIMRLRGIVGQSKSIEKDIPGLVYIMSQLRVEIERALSFLNAKSQHDHEREI